jgi:poly-gamma-glutamate synthesis protein (capsule biosynthesis protein)
VDFSYIWGDALAAFTRMAPDVRMINLETAVTTSDAYWPDKGIHYRVHPANIPCLTALRRTMLWQPSNVGDHEAGSAASAL